jgi:hypothetical protein
MKAVKKIYEYISTSTETITADDPNVAFITSIISKKSSPNIPQAINSMYLHAVAESSKAPEFVDIANYISEDRTWRSIGKKMRVQQEEATEKEIDLLDYYRQGFQNEGAADVRLMMLWMRYLTEMQTPENELSHRLMGIFIPSSQITMRGEKYSDLYSDEMMTSAHKEQTLFYIMDLEKHFSVLKIHLGERLAKERDIEISITTDRKHVELYKSSDMQERLKTSIDMMLEAFPMTYEIFHNSQILNKPILIESPPEMQQEDSWSCGFRCLHHIILKSGYVKQENGQTALLQRLCEKLYEEGSNMSQNYYFMQAFFLLFVFPRK